MGNELNEHADGLVDGLLSPVLDQLNAYWADVQGASNLNKIFYTSHLKFHLLDDLLVKMNRASMANSLEVRSPFLDHRMIEFGASLPANWKVRGRTTKWFPKVAMKIYLPSEVLSKKKDWLWNSHQAMDKGRFRCFCQK